jgi:Zn-dependent M28 family amino/carboxypeptidase
MSHIAPLRLVSAGIAALVVLSFNLVLAAPAAAPRVNSTLPKLLESVTVENVRGHQAAFQVIAGANGGTRVSGLAGFNQSADYVSRLMVEAGYDVSVQSFQFQTFIVLSPTVLTQVAPSPGGPIANQLLSYSGSGDVTAPVYHLSNLGCDAADFAGFPAGAIALISRGNCLFSDKAANAYAAGAVGVIIYNNTAGDFPASTLGEDFTLNIPVTSVSQATGVLLAATSGLVVRLKTDTFRGVKTSYNVLAESKEGDPSNVVMVGAHLDSVNDGPGIQDNGAGSAAILETALQMAKVKPRNKVRFAWWGAAESGQLGSIHYVNTLSSAERDRISLYLNFDTIASPNYVFFIYDGDNSDGVGAGPGPEGSAAIEKVFEEFYTMKGVPFKGTDFTGFSDDTPFRAAGIPSGGLFTGSVGLKTAQEASIWGGTAGIAYDPCYHQACDTFANVSLNALDINADAIAYAVLQFAMNTDAVNGKRGKGNFKPIPTTSTTVQAVR